MNPFTRGNSYGLNPLDLKTLNEGAAVISILEGADAIDNLEEILAVEGLDAFFVGPVDLSAALGHPGQPDHPEVARGIVTILSQISTRDRAAGLYVSET